MRNFLLMMSIGISVCACSGEKKEIYNVPNAPFSARVDDLIKRMTIVVEVGQLKKFVGFE